MLSSRNVIKAWRPEVVREFIPPAPPAPPSVRELKRRVLDGTFRREGADEKDDFQGGEEIADQAAEQEEQGDLRTEEELEEARRQAEEILAKAREEAEKLREEAYQEGFAQGREEGWQEGMRQAAKELEEAQEQQKQMVHQEIAEAIKTIDQAKTRCIKNYLEELKDCSIAVAEKVIHTSLEASGDIIKRMIIFETEKLKKTAWVKIYMEKMDYDMMMEADAGLVTELAKVSDSIKFVVMEKEQRGSCIIETPEEIIDIGVDTQMENIRDIVGTIRA